MIGRFELQRSVQEADHALGALRDQEACEGVWAYVESETGVRFVIRVEFRYGDVVLFARVRWRGPGLIDRVLSTGETQADW